MNKPILVIAGPTGVGKTALALELATHIPATIINADVGQMYAPCTIGTAKPDWRASVVPHCLFDIITEPRDLSSFQFRELVCRCVQDAQAAGRYPVIVGGSGFYIQSLFFQPQPAAGSTGANESFTSAAVSELWQNLVAIDPIRARCIHQHDRYRIERALAIWHNTGQLPSQFQPLWSPLGSRVHLLILTRERVKLHAVIRERTHQMLASGWIDEVVCLCPDWRTYLKRKKFIGYPEIIAYLQAKQSMAELSECIVQSTMAYAKRQMCFFRRLDRLITSQANAHVQVAWAEAHGYTSADLLQKIEQ